MIKCMFCGGKLMSFIIETANHVIIKFEVCEDCKKESLILTQKVLKLANYIPIKELI